MERHSTASFASTHPFPYKVNVNWSSPVHQRFKNVSPVTPKSDRWPNLEKALLMKCIAEVHVLMITLDCLVKHPVVSVYLASLTLSLPADNHDYAVPTNSVVSLGFRESCIICGNLAIFIDFQRICDPTQQAVHVHWYSACVLCTYITLYVKLTTQGANWWHGGWIPCRVNFVVAVSANLLYMAHIIAYVLHNLHGFSFAICDATRSATAACDANSQKYHSQKKSAMQRCLADLARSTMLVSTSPWYSCRLVQLLQIYRQL